MNRVLGLGQLTLIGLGSIIGAGIFSLAGAVARDVSGPAVLLSFLIAGVASLCAAFAYAEFAGMVPRAGSSYTYGRIVLTGMVRYTDVDPKSGFSAAFSSVGLSGVGIVVAIGAVLGIVTVSFSFMLGASRLWYALSRDGLMPSWFGELHPKRRVPHRATWIIGVASAILAGLVSVREVAELTNIGVLFAFIIVSAAVVLIRYYRPDLPRSFRCPGMPVVPILGIGFSAWLMSFLALETWLRLLGWLVLGLVVYALYGYCNTRRVMPGGSVDLAEESRLTGAQPATAVGSTTANEA
jgi:APA family basic amino acid/polyamine antiporter